MDDSLNEHVLVYWLNTLPLASCLLVSDLTELADGDVLDDILREIYPTYVSDPSRPSISRIGEALKFLRENELKVPSKLLAENAAARIANGKMDIMVQLVAFLRYKMGMGPFPNEKGRNPTASPYTLREARRFSGRLSSGLEKHGHPSSARKNQRPPVSGRKQKNTPSLERPRSTMEERSAMRRLSMGRSSGRKPKRGGKSGGSGDESDDPPPATRMRLSASIAQQLGGSARTPSRNRFSTPTPPVRRVPSSASAKKRPASASASLSSSSRSGGSGRSSSLSSSSSKTQFPMSARGAQHAALSPTLGGPMRSLRFSSAMRASRVSFDDSQVLQSPNGEKEVLPRKSSDLLQANPKLSHSRRKRKAATFTGIVSPPSAKKIKEVPLSEKQESLVNWLLGLGIPITPDSGVLTAEKFALKFQDGLLLCQLVEILLREQVTGIHERPRTAGHGSSNISRALRMLRTRKRKMKTRYLFATEDILVGNIHTIFGLLSDLRHAFRKTSSWKKPLAPVSLNAKKQLTPGVTLEAEEKLFSRSISRERRGRIHGRRDEGPGAEEADILTEDHVDDNVRGATRRWLKSLGFNLLDFEDNLEFLKNPMRNGVFLCELVSMLEGKRLLIHRKPDSVMMARQNVERAFAVLRMRRQIPTSFLWSSDRIVRGDPTLLWGLLWHIMKAYPESTHAMQTDLAQRLGVSTLSQTQAQKHESVMGQLEASVLLWLHAIGVVPTSGVPLCLDDILPHIQSGVLLCDTVSVIEGKKIVGVFRNPKIDSTALRNISKALEIMRRRRDMSQRYLWSEQQIRKGDKVVILGLLEDLHRCYDGQPPRSSFEDVANEEEPYFGEFENADQILSHKMAAVMQRDVLGLSRGASSEITMAKADETFPTELNAGFPTPSTLSTFQQRKPFSPEPFLPPGDRAHPFVPPPSQLPRSEMDAMQSSHHGGKSMTRTGMHGGGGGADSSSRGPDASGQPSAGYLLGKWLETIGVVLPSPYSLEGAIVPEFQNGVLLCQVVSTLEREDLRGVTKKPRSNASCLYNIRKALTRLRDKGNMPMEYLWSEEGIRRGEGRVIRGLLEQMRVAYGHHLDEVARSQSRKRSRLRGSRSVSRTRSTSRSRSRA
eukprot:TRINITY_DN396_c0_g1_i3.p1 TRINITY_DN396_c0_g1~~TRINITY_DN396_c0_g1_i3.p1  ORF type:complete len:1114 (+),score=328.12 TRINITY_DN396_c0_g1_i3:2593-5934(+)